MKKVFFTLSVILFSSFFVIAQNIVGIDVSALQGTINWNQVKLSGKTFAFIKSSKGTCYTDTKFFSNMVNANAAGVKVGAYHFALPEDNSAISEANYFLSVAGSYISNGYLLPVLDLEDPAGTCINNSQPLTSYFTSSSLTTWVQTWLTTVQNATGKTPIIYTSASIASYLNSSLNGYKLWIANPGTSQTTQPTNIGNWTTWAFKQYDWFGTVSGISGNVDLDVYNGNASSFNSLLGVGLLPDLTVISPSLSASTVSAGGNIMAYCAEDNSGAASSTVNNVVYYLSPDSVLTPGLNGDVYLNSLNYPGLSANSNSIIYSKNMQIPITTAPGNYYLFFWADGGQVVNESVENNNFVRQPLAVTYSSTTKTISTSVTGSGTASGGGNYSYNQTATLLATPSNGNTFLNWTENSIPVTTNASYSFSVTSNRSLVANFTGCQYSLNSSGVTIYSPATTYFFWVYTTQSCSWTATTSSCSWVTLTNASGTGNGMVIFNVAANTSTSPRNCSITVGGQTFVLTQNGYVAPCSTPPSTPTSISAGVTHSNSLYVSWTGTFTGATNWELERSTSITGPYSLIAYVPILPSYGAYLDSPLTGGVTYYYRVRACCNNNCSNYATVSTGTTACGWHSTPTGVVSSADTICQGDTIKFVVQGGNLGTGDVWKWKNTPCTSSNIIGIGDSILYAPTSSGYVVVRPEGSTCPQPTAYCAIKYFTVRQKPTSSIISANGPTTLCIGDSVLLSGNNGGIWNNNSTAASISVDTSGDYFVTNSNICGNSLSNHILVNALSPALSVYYYPSDTICKGDSVILSGGGANSYSWSSGVINGQPIAPASTTTYILTGTDTNNCSSTLSKNIIVTPAPIANFVASQTSGHCPFNVDFFDQSQSAGNSKYTWTIYNGGSNPVVSSVQNPTSIPYNIGGNFLVKLDLNDKCGASAKNDYINVICPAVVEDLNENSIFKVYPNPSNSNITIEFLTYVNEDVTIQILNLMASKLFESTEKSTNKIYKKIIDLSGLTSGVYYINAISKSGLYSEKVTIIK